MENNREKFVWINNPVLNERKRVPESQADSFLDDGWQRGMVDKEGLIKGIADAVQYGMKNSLETSINIRKTVDSLGFIEKHSSELVGRVDGLRIEMERVDNEIVQNVRELATREPQRPASEPGVDNIANINNDDVVQRLDKLIELGATGQKQDEQQHKENSEEEERQRKEEQKRKRQEKENRQEGEGVASKFRIFGSGGSKSGGLGSSLSGMMAGAMGIVRGKTAMAGMAGLGLLWVLFQNLGDPKIQEMLLGTVRLFRDKIIPFFGDIYENLKDFGADILTNAGDLIGNFENGEFTRGIAEFASGILLSWTENLGDIIKAFGVRFDIEFVQKFGAWLSDLPDQLKPILEVGVESLTGFVGDALQGFDGLKALFSFDEETTIQERVTGAKDALTEGFSMIGRITASVVGLFSPEMGMELNKFLDDFSWSKLYTVLTESLTKGFEDTKAWIVDGLDNTWKTISAWFEEFSFEDLIWNPIKEKILGLKDEILGWVGMGQDNPEELKQQIRNSQTQFQMLNDRVTETSRSTMDEQSRIDAQSRSTVTETNRELLRNQTENRVASDRSEVSVTSSSLDRVIQNQTNQRFDRSKMLEHTKKTNELRFVNEQLNLHERLIQSTSPDDPDRKDAIQTYKTLITEKERLLRELQPQQIAPQGTAGFMTPMSESRSESFIDHRLNSNREFLESVERESNREASDSATVISPGTNTNLRILEKTLESSESVPGGDSEPTVNPQRTSSMMLNMPSQNLTTVNNDYKISLRSKADFDDPILHTLKSRAFARGLA